MGLKGDIDEVVCTWRSAPWRVKLWLALSAFLASGSIASLSETVFKWKGFVQDAVKFYKGFIRTPIVDLLGCFVGIPLPENFVDILSVHMIICVAVIRGIWFVRRKWADRLKFFFLVMAPGLLQSYSSSSYEGSVKWFSLAASYFVVFGFVWATDRGAARFLTLIYLLAPFFIVGLLGAISAGLSK